MTASTSVMTFNKTKASKGLVAGFWISTALFALQMSFTAYAQLRLPQVAEAFAHLGFPDYFRIELSWAKLAGVVALLVPMVPARRDFLYLLKEWAYAGFAITLVSALIAHLAVGDGVEKWSWAAGTGVLWGASYFFWRRLLTRLSEARDAHEKSTYRYLTVLDECLGDLSPTEHKRTDPSVVDEPVYCAGGGYTLSIVNVQFQPR
jgi:DoxX-like family